MQVDLYNGCKMVVIVFLYQPDKTFPMFWPHCMHRVKDAVCCYFFGMVCLLDTTVSPKKSLNRL